MRLWIASFLLAVSFLYVKEGALPVHRAVIGPVHHGHVTFHAVPGPIRTN